jgi:hypothetical protein
MRAEASLIGVRQWRALLSRAMRPSVWLAALGASALGATARKEYDHQVRGRARAGASRARDHRARRRRPRGSKVSTFSELTNDAARAARHVRAAVS